MAFRVPNQFRIRKEDQLNLKGLINPIVIAKCITENEDGNNGAFFIPKEKTKKGRFFWCIVTDDGGWEHVSVAIPTENRVPTWDEMMYIKYWFWEFEDVVVQFMPSKSTYDNMVKNCLHLWSAKNEEMRAPDARILKVK